MHGGIAARLMENRHLLVLAITLILVAGLAAWSNLPRIEDPRIATRNATVLTVLPGADAGRVEALVTKKLEDALREVAEVKTIESTSRGGVSIIAVELDDAVDARTNEQVFSKLRDKLTAAQALLPPEASRPELDDKRGAVAYSLIAAVTWDGPGEPRLGILQRLAEELGDRLRRLSGTEQVVLFGGAREEVRVEVDPGELAALGLSAGDVARTLAAADPRVSAGTLRTGQRRTKLEVAGALDAVDRVAAVPLTAGPAGVVSVGDVATVTRGWREPPEQMAFADGRRALLVGVRTREAVHLDDWARQARAVVSDFGAGVDGVGVSVTFDQSRYTDTRLRELGGNLGAGAAVICLVVFVAMGWRAALIVAAALPLSAALTLFGLDLAHQRIHQMSVFGMIIAIGLLIDNAIIMTDEVRKRLGQGLAPAHAARAAVGYLFVPLVASTFTTILGFLPILLLPGNVGDFVRPIAVSVILALTASFAISMTLIPALAALLVRPGMAGERWWRGGWSSPRLGRLYHRGLAAALHRPRAAVALCLLLPAAGFLGAGSLGNQFFPAADRDQFEVQVWLAPDASVGRTAETVLAMEAMIRAAGEVRGVTWVAGASSPPVYYNQLRDQDDNPPYARGTVLAASPGEAARLVAVLQDLLSDRFLEARVVVRAFGQGPPIPAPVSLRLVGPDTDELRRYGEALRRIMHRLPEVTQTRASIEGGEPKLWLEADEEEARLAGLTLGGIAGQLQGALEGSVGGRLLEDLEDLPVRVRYGPKARGETARVATLGLVSPDSEGWVPAEALGRWVLRPEVASITRRDGERVNTVEAWLRPGALAIDVARALEERIAGEGFELAPGYRLEVAGDSEEQGEALALLLAYAPLLATVMLASLVLSFRSFRIAGIVGVVAVLSVGLGLLSLRVGGYPLGFNPMLGTAGLVGVAINAGIVVLAAIRANPRASTGEPEAVAGEVLGATRHIVATTLTTVAGFLPLLLSGGDFWPPLAVVIAGGVGLSIILGLVLTPALYRLVAGRGSAEGEVGVVPA